MVTSREKIIDIASRLFIQKGYEGCTTIEIAKVAGLSNNSGLFKYFPSKEKMYRTIVDRYLVQQLHASKQKIGSYKRLSLQKFIELYLKKISEARIMLHSFINGGEKSSMYYLSFRLECGERFEDCARAAVAFDEEEVNLWQDVIQRAIGSGEVKPDTNAYAVAKMFWYSYMGMSYMYSAKGGITDEDARGMLYDIYNMIKS
ncbi:MAG: TetR/AcrR family transcriptional regulator [Prevotellaceae bacterium]|jgi:AcrR family transcriptional regulator|nr:TetR/AcrR family transcriptional regulator [Prevotellaceae bacterium]